MDSKNPLTSAMLAQIPDGIPTSIPDFGADILYKTVQPYLPKGLESSGKSPQEIGGDMLYNSIKPYIPQSLDKPGKKAQTSRALALGAYFFSGSVAANAAQILGTPLALVNNDWYRSWIAFTMHSWGLLTMTMTQWWSPTIVRVSGDKSVRGQLLKTKEGQLFCDFAQRAVLMANHQIYTDWMYLWYIGYTNGMHGRFHIVLKESLKKIPVIGWGMQLANFIFLKRNWEQDKPNLASHLQALNKASDPMWLIIFPEGTNLADSTRARSKAWAEKKGIPDMKHQLLPRSTGLQFCLQELRQTVDWLYDCTIAYEGVQHGQYAQDIYTLQSQFVGGKPPKSINMYWRRFAISTIPVHDDKLFSEWLQNRWNEKDKLIEDYLLTGRFPADTGYDKDDKGNGRRGCGYIETEIKPYRWYEFLQVYAPIATIVLVIYMFYGALPEKLLSTISGRTSFGELEEAFTTQIAAIKNQVAHLTGGGITKARIEEANKQKITPSSSGSALKISPPKKLGPSRKTMPTISVEPVKKPSVHTTSAPKAQPNGTTSQGVTAKKTTSQKPLPKTVLPMQAPTKVATEQPVASQQLKTSPATAPTTKSASTPSARKAEAKPTPKPPRETPQTKTEPIPPAKNPTPKPIISSTPSKPATKPLPKTVLPKPSSKPATTSAPAKPAPKPASSAVPKKPESTKTPSIASSVAGDGEGKEARLSKRALAVKAQRKKHLR